jgi:hypothetical protein
MAAPTPTSNTGLETAPPVNPEVREYEAAEARDAVREEHEVSGSDGGTAVEELQRSANGSFVGDLEDRHVSVSRGKQEFAALERKFSTMSQESADAPPNMLRRVSTGMSFRSAKSNMPAPRRTVTHQSIAEGKEMPDVEKAEGGDDEFNLADELRAGRDARDAADIKHKRVGVVWEDLEVVGGGG